MNKKHINIDFGGLISKRIKDGQKETLFAELASLLIAGLDFSTSFRMLIDSQGEGFMKDSLCVIFNDVLSGSAMWEAMQRSGHFSALDSGVIRIGEQTGRIGESLKFLSDYYRKKSQQRRMIISAVSYPLIILIVALLVVAFMIVVIVPMFEQVYSRMGGELPLITRWLIDLSDCFPAVMSLSFMFVISVSLLIYAFREREVVRRTLALVLLRIPFVGTIVRKSIQARFCKLLYLLIISGVTLLTSIEMLQSIITLYPYQQSLFAISKGLCRGEQFAANLSKFNNLYGKKTTSLLAIGEQTNGLPQMLLMHGDELTGELEFRIKQLGTILEPLLILLVGCLVAVILIAMYLPMFQLGNNIN